jgi:DNA polymerase III delta subunit
MTPLPRKKAHNKLSQIKISKQNVKDDVWLLVLYSKLCEKREKLKRMIKHKGVRTCFENFQTLRWQIVVKLRMASRQI